MKQKLRPVIDFVKIKNVLTGREWWECYRDYSTNPPAGTIIINHPDRIKR